MGTAGNDDWLLKVSPAGSTWQDAVVVNRNDGAVSISQELATPDGVKIANHGTTDRGGVEIQARGTFGKMAMTPRSFSNVISLGPLATLVIPQGSSTGVL